MPGLFRHPPQPQPQRPKVVPATPPPPAFDPATGFPFNTPDEAYQSQCFPDPTTDIANAFGPPLNAVSAQAFNVPDEGAYQPTVDETAPALTLGIPAELTTPFNKPDEAGPQSNLDDTSPAWAVGPPLNATQAQAFNVPDEGAAQANLDESVQSYAIQPPAAVAFNPAAGFPWNQDEGERFVQSQIVDDAINWALGQPPLNAASAQAFNVPDEGAYQPVVDVVAQPYSIQPPAAAAFDPAGGFPWPVDELVVLPTVIDDTAQPWAIQPPLNAVSAQVFNVPDEGAYQTAPDDTAPAWAIQPPAAAAFDPAGGFPWPVDDVIVSWPTYTDDTAQSWAVQPPLNAASAQAFNVPDEGAYQPVVDVVAQPYSIQPPAAFDPANGFPFNQDEGERFVVPQVWPDTTGPVIGLVPIAYISGVTRDSDGARLGFCVVKLYRTSDDAFISQTISAADGSYRIAVTPAVTYYLVAYLVGVPDVAGTTLNTIMGSP